MPAALALGALGAGPPLGDGGVRLGSRRFRPGGRSWQLIWGKYGENMGEIWGKYRNFHGKVGFNPLNILLKLLKMAIDS